MTERVAAMQIDLDGSWTYSAYLGESVDIRRDPLYEKALPVLLDLLSSRGIRATLFLVGRDLGVDWKVELLRQAVRKGHEIASHSMNHVLRFSKLSRGEKSDEIGMARRLCTELLGIEQIGFRAPGFDIDWETLSLLEAMGFVYDSSIIPTYAYPFLLRADRIGYLLRRRRIPGWDHGPKLGWFMAPEGPYRPCPGRLIRSCRGSGIVEVPVSTHPVLRLPFHLAFGLRMGPRLFDLGRSSLDAKGLPLVYLIHLKDLRDFVERGDRRPIAMIEHVLDIIAGRYDALTTSELARNHGGHELG